MPKRDKLIDKVMRGSSDADILFEDLRRILLTKGFEERIRGDHHIFTKVNVDEILNIQPKGHLAKPYQVRQIRDVFLRYGLGGHDDQV